MKRETKYDVLQGGKEEDYPRWGWLRERMKRKAEDETLPRAE